ncbi:TlpA family protein disulfide reductase [Paenibacillus sp. SYP-B3998]|uniref:TlpA family protein disulfide reductase n=1 Tax=Paenibacillus sp. SYP-B3998 TaxID=2678564 RepID=A0A6G4A351_9BACL|nr:TlpA disulfide reductase family protein [Paenibacillus sp. SYP-B3998]NEW08718.1 TlpA family protein disulfide reductase [Paenibacillus sp. SYP-B3998]
MKRNGIILAFVLLLAGLAVYQNAQHANKETIMPTEQAPKVNYLAPAFTLTGLDGQSYAVGGPRDKPLLVNFWASWCGPCAIEAPDLVAMYKKYEGQFDLYAVNVTPGDKMDNIKKFVEEYKFPFPVLLDKKGENADAYRVLAIPTTFLIDKNGVVREVIHVLSPKELDKKIANLIKN